VSETVSREEELAVLHAFIGRTEGETVALVLEGEAGIGKSTLWLAGVEHARASGFRVLASQPAEAERGLAHVALSDLFGDVLTDVLPALSSPRRRALEVALLNGSTRPPRARSRSRCAGSPRTKRSCSWRAGSSTGQRLRRDSTTHWRRIGSTGFPWDH
jgi:hypothetical protein